MPRNREWLLFLGAAVVVLAASFATGVHLFMPRAWGAQVSWSRTFLYNLAHFLVWAALVPLLVALAQRLPLENGAWRKALPLQILASSLLSVVQLAVAELILTPFLPAGDPVRPTLLRAVRFSLGINFQGAVMTYWAISGAAYAWFFHQRELEASRIASRLEAMAADERFRTLESHVAPHFLFNALNSVVALVDIDPSEAKRLIARLGDLLRRSLAARERATLTVGEELDVVRRYLEIERARFDDRLRFEIDAAPDTLPCEIPSFLLQPLVENAVRHGLQPSTRPVTIALRARLDGAGRLRIEIEDDGGASGGSKPGSGLGLKRTRARLKRFGDGDYGFHAGPRTERGFLVRIEIPAAGAGSASVAAAP